MPIYAVWDSGLLLYLLQAEVTALLYPLKNLTGEWPVIRESPIRS